MNTSVLYSIENPNIIIEINQQGTLNLLRCCTEAKVNKLISVSSCAIYDGLQSLIVSENHSVDPISPCAKSKLEGEHHCQKFNEVQLVRTIVLRFFNVYGPRQGIIDYCGVIPRFVERCKQRLQLIVYGEYSQTEDFVYEDVAKAILNFLLVKKMLKVKFFNIGLAGQFLLMNQLMLF